MSDEGATKGMTALGIRMSNFDHEIEEGLDEKLREGNTFACYTAWDFLGRVWHDGDQFCCEIWQYMSIKEIIKAPCLEKLMEACSEKYGIA